MRAAATQVSHPVGPDGCGPVTADGKRNKEFDVRERARHSSGPPGRARPVTATGNRDNKEIRSMSGPMSERAPDITVEADGRADTTTVLVAKVSSGPTAAVP
jgi:hypothetical protein